MPVIPALARLTQKFRSLRLAWNRETMSQKMKKKYLYMDMYVHERGSGNLSVLDFCPKFIINQ